MSRWATVDELARDFDLAELSEFPEQLLDALRRQLTELHPDKTGGKFATISDEERFLRLREAIDFVEASGRRQLATIPIDQLPALLSAMAQAVAPSATPSSLERSYLSETRHELARGSLLPKLGSGAFLAVTGFIFALPGQFESHPLIGPMLKDPKAQAVLFALLVYSGVLFVGFWLRERAAEALAEFLVSERAVLPLFQHISGLAHDSGRPNRVSYALILEAMHRLAQDSRHYRRPFTLFARRLLDESSMERAAEVQIARLVERKALKKLDQVTLAPTYEINLDLRYEA